MSSLEERLLQALKEKEQKPLDDTLESRLLTALQSPAIEQRAGSVPTKAGLKSLLPTKRQLPELIGAIGAGIKASKMAVPLGAAVTGSGGMLGEIVTQGRQAVTGDDPPTSFRESLGRSAAAFSRGAAGELGARALAKSFTMFRGGVTPELEAGRRAAESVGIEPPLSVLTESKFLQATEKGLESTPFGHAITKQRRKALEGLKNYSEIVGKGIAPDLPAEVQGELIKKKFVDVFKTYHDTTGKMYNTIIPMIRQANPSVFLNKTIGKLREIIENRTAELEPAGLNRLRRLYNNLAAKETEFIKPSGRFIPAKEKIVEEGIPSMLVRRETVETPSRFISGVKTGIPKVPTAKGGGGMLFADPKGWVDTFDLLKKTRTNLGDSLSAGFDDLSRSGLKEDLEGLYGAMTEDLNATVGKVSQEALKDFQAAGAMRAKTQKFVESELFGAIEKFEPQNVYKLIITPNSPSKIATGKEILGDKFNDVVRQWWDNIVRFSTNPDKSFSPVRLAKKLDSYGSTIEAIAKDNPVLMEQFGNVQRIANLLSKGREVTQGSQTAFNQVAIGQYLLAIGAMLSNPSQALKSLGVLGGTMGAEALGVKGFMSKTGREFLTRGFPRVGKAVTRTTQPFAQLGVQKLSDQE